MSLSILDIHRRSNDANIGQTLLRLAGLAESVHSYEAVQQLRGEIERETGIVDEAMDCSSFVDDATSASESVRTEVNR